MPFALPAAMVFNGIDRDPGQRDDLLIQRPQQRMRVEVAALLEQCHEALDGVRHANE